MNQNISEISAPDVDGEFRAEFIPKIPEILPMERMYSIQVGSKCYKISGASLSSDSPSYFTNYFSKPENADKTLFIDRSPVVFDRIILHLQGYFVEVKTPMDFVYLFSDAFYYDLPRLKEQLYRSDIFVNIGNKSFKISKKTMNSKGNFPNFFSIAYNTIFKDPTTLISNLDLLRPPPQAPIVLIDRCDKLFEIILNYLQGYEVPIQCDDMRNKLMRECRYYRFLELEQRLVKHSITLNPFTIQEEITINLKDVKRKGLSVNPTLTPGSNVQTPNSDQDITQDISFSKEYHFAKYSRPYVDTNIYRVLILQIISTETFMIIDRAANMVKVKFINNTAKQMQSLFSNFISNPFLSNCFMIFHNENPEITNSLTIQAVVENSCYLKLNDNAMKEGWLSSVVANSAHLDEIPLTIIKSKWKIQVKQDSFRLQAVKLEGLTSHFNWNKTNDFL
ncbi:Mrx16 protein [Saccharomycopsis crataegensis]|uniref:Mrx16 protein n=1 Tax=Saccharomycopsis crataegensis TaxID=43959 RepID=A0AAV5QI08_9ASCO|nr:Mrx16 protein [Saccharomycopsis crataegensis]